MTRRQSPPAAWSEHPALVEFYADHRDTPADLYPSERRFLPWLAERWTSVLDVGCAAGGFCNIWRAYRSDIAYTGVDVSVALVDMARTLHPDAEFHVGDCAEGLPLPAGFADAVQALGWMHWEPRYRDALRELWRVTGHSLFFDMRLVDEREDRVGGRQQVAFSAAWDTETTVPYISAGWPSFAQFLRALDPAAILGYGYWGSPADTVIGVDYDVYFATFVLEKRAPGAALAPTTVCVGELAWPEEVSSEVTVLPSTDLDDLVPPEHHGGAS